MSAWTDLVKQVYNENKGKPGYKLGDAMKEARQRYKKGAPAVVEVAPSKKSRKSRKGRKNKTTKRK